MKFVVPIDGSAAAECAFDHALSLATANPGALLILVNVQTPDALGFPDIQMSGADARALAGRQSETVLRKSVEACEKHHVSCETRAEYGEPVAETIVRIARETGADHIVMGARGLGRLRGLVLGSATTQVVHLADIPVTVVKATLRQP